VRGEGAWPTLRLSSPALAWLAGVYHTAHSPLIEGLSSELWQWLVLINRLYGFGLAWIGTVLVLTTFFFFFFG